MIFRHEEEQDLRRDLPQPGDRSASLSRVVATPSSVVDIGQMQARGQDDSRLAFALPSISGPAGALP
jgi:hypothetical protein